MTSSDMQDTPAGRRAARADGPRSSQPKRRTFTAAYKLAMIEKYDAATEPGAKGALLRGEGLYYSCCFSFCDRAAAQRGLWLPCWRLHAVTSFRSWWVMWRGPGGGRRSGASGRGPGGVGAILTSGEGRRGGQW